MGLGIKLYLTDAERRARSLAEIEHQVRRREWKEAARHGFIDAQAGRTSRAVHLMDRPDIAKSYADGYRLGQEAPSGSTNPFE